MEDDMSSAQKLKISLQSYLWKIFGIISVTNADILQRNDSLQIQDSVAEGRMLGDFGPGLGRKQRQTISENHAKMTTGSSPDNHQESVLTWRYQPPTPTVPQSSQLVKLRDTEYAKITQ